MYSTFYGLTKTPPKIRRLRKLPNKFLKTSSGSIIGKQCDNLKFLNINQLYEIFLIRIYTYFFLGVVSYFKGKKISIRQHITTILDLFQIKNWYILQFTLPKNLGLPLLNPSIFKINWLWKLFRLQGAVWIDLLIVFLWPIVLCYIDMFHC